jgi:hypothetical protein
MLYLDHLAELSCHGVEVRSHTLEHLDAIPIAFLCDRRISAIPKPRLPYPWDNFTLPELAELSLLLPAYEGNVELLVFEVVRRPLYEPRSVVGSRRKCSRILRKIQETTAKQCAVQA